MGQLGRPPKEVRLEPTLKAVRELANKTQGRAAFQAERQAKVPGWVHVWYVQGTAWKEATVAGTGQKAGGKEEWQIAKGLGVQCRDSIVKVNYEAFTPGKIRSLQVWAEDFFWKDLALAAMLRTDCNGWGWKQGVPVRLLSSEEQQEWFHKWTGSGCILEIEHHPFLADWIWDDKEMGSQQQQIYRGWECYQSFWGKTLHWHHGTDVTAFLIYLVSPNFKFPLVHSFFSSHRNNPIRKSPVCCRQMTFLRETVALTTMTDTPPQKATPD